MTIGIDRLGYTNAMVIVHDPVCPSECSAGTPSTYELYDLGKPWFTDSAVEM